MSQPLTIIEPVRLDLTDGRTVQLMCTAGGALRIKKRTGLDLTKDSVDVVKLDPNQLCQYLSDMLVRWDGKRKRPGYTYDAQLQDEADTCECGKPESEHPTDACADFQSQLLYTVDLPAAAAAFVTAVQRGFKGLPRMPLPSENGTAATATNQSTSPETSETRT